VISKENCPRCDTLKKWLKEKNIIYEEWPIEKEEIKHKLLHDPKFIQTFCDVDGCMVYTPVIRFEDTGEYYFKELFNQIGIRDKFVIDLIGL
jgi:hypothetical protein